jgi:hypothetical protein
MKTRRVSDDVMRSWINAWFQRRRCQEESISYLVQLIRDEGMSFPTRHSFAMDEFERLGYRLRSDTNKYGSLLRTYVVCQSN